MSETVATALRIVFGNASSAHRAGQVARQQLERARGVMSEFLGAQPAELVFTSGGTESNNLAILGLMRGLPGSRKHIITSAIEHPAVMEPCRQLSREGCDVSFIEVDDSGVVSVSEIARALRPETVLISVMHANNEVGTIQPIAEVAAVVQERRAAGQTIFLHSDGVQAAGKIKVNVASLGVDLYSTSAHKMYAPKGVGALFVRKGTPLIGIQYGGRHERGRRPGTENVVGAMAFARAVELSGPSEAEYLKTLRDQFERKLLARDVDAEVNGARDQRLPNTSNILFRGISGEALLIALDLQDMAVSTGAACSSGSTEPSHVLLAMGRTREEARSCIRFSFGRYNTAAEVDALVEAVAGASAKLNPTRREKQLV